MLLEKVLDIGVGLATSFLLLLCSIFFIHRSLNKQHKEEGKEKVALELTIKSFTKKIILEKLDSAVFEEMNNRGKKENMEEEVVEETVKPTEGAIKVKATSIESIKETKSIAIADNEVFDRYSKNYGADEKFSIRTWYGINLRKLNEERYKYICFHVKNEIDENGREIKILFKKEKIVELINNKLDATEQEKYRSRNSFDTYLMKGKNDNKWYITRIGMHLKEPVEIRNA